MTTPQDIINALQTAIWRLEDMLKADDGQAWKEAEKALPKLKATLQNAQLIQQRGGEPVAWRTELLSHFPLLNDEGLDEDKHHCEWAIQQERKRLHAMLSATPTPPDSDKVDAERYRWLKKQNETLEINAWTITRQDFTGAEGAETYWVGADLDAVIDNAMTQAGTAQNQARGK